MKVIVKVTEISTTLLLIVLTKHKKFDADAMDSFKPIVAKKEKGRENEHDGGGEVISSMMMTFKWSLYMYLPCPSLVLVQ